MPTKFCETILPDFKRLEQLLQQSKATQMSNFGPLYHQFLKELATWFKLNKSRSLTVTSSGHTALMTAFHLCNTKVALVPSYTFVSTNQAALLQGINTVVVDVELDTGTFSIDALEFYKYDIDTVVVVCPLSCIPRNLEAVSAWCKRNNKKLIIDGAATFGTPGPHFNLGDAYCVSFHATKNLPVGEGGCIIHHKEEEEVARQFITFGLDANKDASILGLNAKVSEYTCGIGLCLLEAIDHHLRSRLYHTEVYANEIKQRTLPTCDGTVHSCYPIYFDQPDDAINKVNLLRKRGHEVIQYYKPLDNAENANRLYNTNICLPCHSQLTTYQVLDIIRAINE